MTEELDLLILAELNPDVLVSAGAADVRFGQVEQLVDRAAITLGSSGAITASAAAVQGLRVAVCAVVGDDQVGTWTTELLADRGVDVTRITRRAGRQTGLSVVITRSDGDRAILTYSGTISELSAADVPVDLLRAARHVHASSFFLQRGLQGDLPTLLSQARAAGATTSVDPGWAPLDEWTKVRPVLPEVDYLLPNAAECVHMALALHGKSPGADEMRDEAAVLRAAEVVHRFGPSVAVKMGAAGALVVEDGFAARVQAEDVAVVDTTGAGDSFNAGFIAGLLDDSPVTASIKRAVSSGSIAVTGWGGTGRLATREEAVSGAAQLTAVHLQTAPDDPGSL